MNCDVHSQFPAIRQAGFDGLLVSFGDKLSEPANRAALAFRHAVEQTGWDGVDESSTSLVSTYLRFDPLAVSHEHMRAKVQTLLATQDWFSATLQAKRKLWRIPTVFGTDQAPQLAEAAAIAGLSELEAIDQIANTQVRVQTIGFAPGQPYLGELPQAWDIPRQTELTPRVPIGALTVAIRQLVLFSVSTPTGWRHIGQTAFRLFRPESAEPFLLRPGDEVLFCPVALEQLDTLQQCADGGASFTSLG